MGAGVASLTTDPSDSGETVGLRQGTGRIRRSGAVRPRKNRLKLISQDENFIYYMSNRADGKCEGIRVGRSTGVCGFVSNTPTEQQRHPVPFLMHDNEPVFPPVNWDGLPTILRNALGSVEQEHPEIHALLTGAIGFEDALRS